jgi:Fe-S cluster assembly protein SufB
MAEEKSILEEITSSEYKYGFSSDIETETAPKGLNEDIVRFISAKKNEPTWMLESRLKAYQYWLTLKEPRHWAHIEYPAIDFQDIIYYAAPKKNPELKSLYEVDPELLRTF